jgi:curli biogenesis system outer membrane secretion channel CsgG
MTPIKKNMVITCLLASVTLAGCASSGSNLNLVEGPAIIDVVTPFDAALACLDGRIDKRLGFAVGNIPDGTGREAYDEGGTGKFVTQSGGDIVQSALFKTGVKVINRRDMGSAAMEAQWGIRSLQSQQVSHFAITGSINSLDFIPGAGAFVNVGGVGARYGQNRILVGLDLAMTNVATGQIVSNIALKKQIVADDAGIFGSRFTNNRVVDADIGGGRREALNDALRAMLQLATYELMIQLMPPQEYDECMRLIDPRYGVVGGNKTAGEQYAAYREGLQPQPVNRATVSEVSLTSPTDGELPSSAVSVDAAGATPPSQVTQPINTPDRYKRDVMGRR